MAQYTDEDIALMSREEKLDLLDQAKDAYYNTGEELITDAQYDALEAEMGLENKNYVGSKHGSYTVQHSFIMGSLAKVQITENKDTGYIDWDLFANKLNSYFKKSHGNKYIEITPKLDGASFSAEFKNNNGKAKLISCGTRGDGLFGKDIRIWFEPMLKTSEWSKIDDACRNILADDEILCIRGEVLVPSSNFTEDYADSFANPRAYVAGRIALKQSEVSPDMITGSNIHFVCYDYRIVNENDKSFQELDWMNPMDSTYKILRPYLDHIGELPNLDYCFVMQKPKLTGNDLAKIYEDFSEFRSEISEYALDGIVFKPEASARQYNDTRDRPEDCVAMKFIPLIEETTIKDIIWDIKKSGEYFPTAIIKPVTLDGKNVERASLYNINDIIKKNCGIGSTVNLAMKGEIIPGITKIISHKDVGFIKRTEILMPNGLPSGSYDEEEITREEFFMLSDIEKKSVRFENINQPEDSEISIDPKSGNLHLMKVFKDDSEKEKMRFMASANALIINGVGPAVASKLYDALHNDIDNLINIVYLMKPDMYNLIYSRLGSSRSTDNIIKGLKDFAQHITLEDVILSFCFKNCGHRASALCAKIISGDNYSTSGFSSAVYGWAGNSNSNEYNMVMDVVNELNIDITPKTSSNSGSQIPIIMTGSPKDFGYNTKKDFLNAHPEYVETTSWTECKILFTDDLSSTSGKMKKAAKAGIEVRLYE